MKTPLTYYGGKQQLSQKIVELMPSHKVYCEPFIGGGAVFFRKEASDSEIINDINGELINFYEVLKRDYSGLYQEISISLHSRELHTNARVIHEHPKLFTRIQRAWAVWMLANESFGSMLDGGWGYDRSGQTTSKIANKRNEFSEELAIRLQNVQIECTDALRIIRSRDSESSFFYLDPPYPNTDQGHYDGYSEEDFIQLLKVAEGLEGKFLLSSFRNKYLNEFTQRNGWSQIEIRMAKPMAAHSKRSVAKIEVLTANYPIS